MPLLRFSNRWCSTLLACGVKGVGKYVFSPLFFFSDLFLKTGRLTGAVNYGQYRIVRYIWVRYRIGHCRVDEALFLWDEEEMRRVALPKTRFNYRLKMVYGAGTRMVLVLLCLLL